MIKSEGEAKRNREQRSKAEKASNELFEGDGKQALSK